MSRLEFSPVRSLFEDIQLWGTPRLPEGGGYVVSHNDNLIDGKPWLATYAGGGLNEREHLGRHASRAEAEAACEAHRQRRIQ